MNAFCADGMDQPRVAVARWVEPLGDGDGIRRDDHACLQMSLRHMPLQCCFFDIACDDECNLYLV
jgi:hypothetical protein